VRRFRRDPLPPVSEIDGYQFPVGPITRTLMDDFTALTRPARVRAAVGG